MSDTVSYFSEMASVYDKRNAALSPIAENMHFLIRLILTDAPARARVLCVGVGTGAEILALSKSFPEWTFVGVDPSDGMLDVCRERLWEAGVLDRCELIHGYVQDVPPGQTFDAVLNILVAHFVKREDRPHFYQQMWHRLCVDGVLISTEICYDLNSEAYPCMLRNWATVQSLMGARAESLASLPVVLGDMLTVISPTETEALVKQNGIHLPVRFFQNFMINGWYATKRAQ